MKKLLLVALAGTALSALAQNHYVSTGGPETIVNNINNCTAHNCLIAQNLVANSTSPANLAQVASGQDGYVLGIDPSANVWTLPLADNARSAWTPVPSMGQVYGLTILDQSDVYGLGASCGGPFTVVNGIVRATPDRTIQAWNGSAWRSLGRCANQVSIGGDGTLASATVAGSIWFTTNPTASNPTWTQFYPATGNAVWIAVQVYSQNLAFALDNTNTINQLDLVNQTASVMAGAPLSNYIAVTNDGYLYAAAIYSGSKGNLYHYKFATGNPTWVNFTGGANSVWGRLSDLLFFLSSGTPYHFLASAKYYATSVSGYYDCSQFPNGCPVGSVHTVKANVSYLGGYSSGTSSASGVPAASIGASHHDIGGSCDLFFGNPQAPECTPTANTSEVCSKMGNLGGSSSQQNSSTTRWGWVLERNQSGPAGGYNCTTLPLTKIRLCDFKTTQWCVNQPQYSVSEIYDYSPGPISWTLFYKCEIKTDGTYGSCWSPIGSAIVSDQPGPIYCVNP